MTTTHVWLLIGLSAFGVSCLLLAAWGGARSGTAAAVHPAQHRALDPAPVEVIRIPPRIEGIARRVKALPMFPMDGATATIADRYRAIVGGERTEETPALVDELPVEHVEVSETSTPLADVFVPLTTVVEDGLPRALAEHVTDSASGDARHLGRIDGALRGFQARLDASGVNALIDQWLRDAGELPGRAEARRAAYPTCDDPSIEIPVAELAALLATVGAR